MDTPLYTQAAALAEANAVALTICSPDATPPIVGKVRLFNATLVPTVLTTKDELIAAEAAFTGYPAGGYTLGEFNPAILATGGGAVVYAPTIPVQYTAGDPSSIGGYWVEGESGLVRLVYSYAPARQLAVAGDGWPIVVSLGYGRNA